MKSPPEQYATRWGKDHPIIVRSQDRGIDLPERVISRRPVYDSLPHSSSHLAGFVGQYGKLDSAYNRNLTGDTGSPGLQLALGIGTENNQARSGLSQPDSPADKYLDCCAI